MVRAIGDQAGEQARYTATLMYRAWKGWSFADKKQPSPWLTFLIRRIQKRIGPSFLGENLASQPCEGFYMRSGTECASLWPDNLADMPAHNLRKASWTPGMVWRVEM
jgi:hypothetical protein